MALILCTPAFALEESEVEAAVAASSKEAVTGNVLIWFLCAVAFLKVSQKIDSFMATLGVNVGRTGGSMLAEAMIAARGVTTVAGVAGHTLGRGRSTAGSTGVSGAAGSSGASGGFFKGGLIGMAGRKITNSAVKTATTQTGTTAHTAQTAVTAHTNNSGIQPHPATPQTDGQSDSVLRQDGVIQTGGEQVAHSSSEKSHSETVRQGGGGGSISERHTVNQTRSVENTQHSTHSSFPVRMPTLGGKIFSNSLQSGGQFANDVIGMVARGDMRSTGSITGDLAAQSLQSYMGHTAIGSGDTEKVSYSQVEIGGGRITGREVTPEHPQGIDFAMYHVDQYAKPEGSYQKVFSADGAAWYKQQAVDTVVKTPFKAPDGEIGYQKEIVKRLPTPPKRKDRM